MLPAGQFQWKHCITVNLFGRKQFKQGHLSIGSWKWILMEVIFCGKNVSVLKEWKKPYVKTSVLHDIHIESCVNEKC